MSTSMTSLPSKDRLFPPSSEMIREAHVAGMAVYEALCTEARADYEGFWGRLARQNLVWDTPFTTVLNEENAPFYRWFEDGVLNASANCLDRHMGTSAENKVAIRFESDSDEVMDVTYRQLLDRVCRFANALKAQGVKKGDRVVIYLPMGVEGVVVMQACARIGAVHSVVYGGFSAKALHERIVDAGAVLVVTANAQKRGGRELALKSLVDEALAMGGCESVRGVLVHERTPSPWVRHEGRDKTFQEVLEGCADWCPPEPVEAEHPLFILYTSGSTGGPKGVVQATAGFLLWARQTMEWTFDIRPTDVYWCTADIGWITGHSYVAYGPLAAGATQIIFEGVPTYPDAGRFWRMIERHRVSVFYTAPTVVRALAKASGQDESVHPDRYDLSSLRILATVGEPIGTETWMWFYTTVGHSRCACLDTFFQTETGGHVITPLPGATPLQPGSCGLPLPGILADVVDETGREVPRGYGGTLVIRRPFPSMMRTLWNNSRQFQERYFPKEFGETLYVAGDGAMREDVHGFFRITGRMDDVLNVSGHRFGTMEIESALVSRSDLVAEAAVIGRPDDVTGEAICAFVVPKGSVPEGEAAVQMAHELRQWVAREIGPIAKPKDFYFGEALPKTRSGKIMRRLLRVLARGEAVTQDISSLENPAVLRQWEMVIR